MVWSHLMVLWHDEANSSGGSERNKEERKTEDEMIRQHQGMEFGDSLWAAERQGRVERYCCNTICGAPTTSEVKELR